MPLTLLSGRLLLRAALHRRRNTRVADQFRRFPAAVDLTSQI